MKRPKYCDSFKYIAYDICKRPSTRQSLPYKNWPQIPKPIRNWEKLGFNIKIIKTGAHSIYWNEINLFIWIYSDGFFVWNGGSENSRDVPTQQAPMDNLIKTELILLWNVNLGQCGSALVERSTHQPTEGSLWFYWISTSVDLRLWINKRQFRLRLVHLLNDNPGNLRCAASIGRPIRFFLSLLLTETVVISFGNVEISFFGDQCYYYSCSDS